MNNQDIEILLIEDNIYEAELAIRSLKKNSVATNIIHLKDGVTALDFLFGTGIYAGRDVHNKPRLILLDLKMPKLGGLEVLARVASDKLTKNIPVVVLTSSREHPDVKTAYDLGANSYIVKPVNVESFRQVVSQLGIYWLKRNHPLE